MRTWEENAVCEIHGEYVGKFFSLRSNKKHGGACQKCVEIQEEKDRTEKERVENERLILLKERKRTRAGISKRNINKTFDHYICKNEGQQKAKSDCIRFSESFPSDKSLIMVGGVGTGKTLLASAILDSLVDDYRCEIIKLIDLVRELKATWSKDSENTEENLINYYSNLDLLIIDEVGAQFGSDTEKLFIFDIIDGRYQEMKPTILISNLDINGIKESIGERCVDRLREGGGSMIAFNWESSRA